MIEKVKAQVSGILDAKFPFQILSQFEELDEKYVKFRAAHKKFVFYDKVDANKIVINTNVKQGIKITIISMIIVLVVLLIGNFYTDSSGSFDNIFMGLILLVTFLVLIISIIRFFRVKDRFIELNRKEGIIKFQKPLKNEVFELPFNEMEAVWQGIGGSSPDMLLVFRSKNNKNIGFRSSSPISHIRRGLLRETLSFYVWYMDKNRPLPRGSAFDPYRKADFERRKSEGFPKPLYRSYIPTPEATPEQQLEREHYWKDHLEQFTREPHSVMYNPEIHKDWVSARWLNDDDSPVVETFFKFEFENGDIVYIKTDESGVGFKPANGQKYITTRIEPFQSWF